MHRLFTEDGAEEFLVDELRRGWPSGRHGAEGSRWIWTDAPLEQSERPLLAFCRQALVNARNLRAPSINRWAEQLTERLTEELPEGQPWRLHIWPDYGTGKAGVHRCALIRAAVRERLQRRHRRLLRNLEEEESPFDQRTSLVQLVLTTPEEGILSAAASPLPWRLRTIVWPFPRGELPVAEDKAAPSRAFVKLLEAEQRLGVRISSGDRCADLGASPGSWSYVALGRGAFVTAVDRSELREDLMNDPRLAFQRGDAFKFRPADRADWLLCDVIAAPQRSIDLLLEWLREGRMSRFVVSIKFKGAEDYPLLDQLKAQAAPLCSEFFLTRLCANKNEVCAFGSAR